MGKAFERLCFHNTVIVSMHWKKKKRDHDTAFSKLIWETDPRCQKKSLLTLKICLDIVDYRMTRRINHYVQPRWET